MFNAHALTLQVVLRVYVCKVTGCEYTNPERKAFENHVRIEHPDECWICELCGRNFSGWLTFGQKVLKCINSTIECCLCLNRSNKAGAASSEQSWRSGWETLPTGQLQLPPLSTVGSSFFVFFLVSLS